MCLVRVGIVSPWLTARSRFLIIDLSSLVPRATIIRRLYSLLYFFHSIMDQPGIPIPRFNEPPLAEPQCTSPRWLRRISGTGSPGYETADARENYPTAVSSCTDALVGN